MKNPGIYILTCKINGKKYVGLDSQLPKRINHHLNGHSNCRYIQNALKKHGTNAFDIEIIQYPGISPKALSEIERITISKLNTLAPNGYNLTTGGEKPTFSKTSLQKMSKAFSGKNNPNYGKKHSPETRKKISKARKGQKAWNKGIPASKESREKLSKNNGSHRPEVRQKISNSLKGEKSPNFGKKFSKEHREKISKSKKIYEAKKREKERIKNGQLTLF